MDTTEQLHIQFNRAIVCAKWLRVGTAACALAAQGLALILLLGADTWEAKRYFPLFGLVPAIAAALLGFTEKKERSHAETCRRLSARAFGLGKSTPALAANKVLDAVPAMSGGPIGRWITVEPPSKYYSVRFPPGPQRLHEMYLEKVYFTRRLTSAYGTLLIGSAVLVGVAGFIALVLVAMELGADKTTLDRWIEILLSVVFIGSLLWLVNKAVDATGSEAALAEIETNLSELSPQASDSAEFWLLTRDYDAEQVALPLVPTFIYKLKRKRLNDGFEKLRTAWLTQFGVVPETFQAVDPTAPGSPEAQAGSAPTVSSVVSPGLAPAPPTNTPAPS